MEGWYNSSCFLYACSNCVCVRMELGSSVYSLYYILREQQIQINGLFIYIFINKELATVLIIKKTSLDEEFSHNRKCYFLTIYKKVELQETNGENYIDNHYTKMSNEFKPQTFREHAAIHKTL